MRKNFIRFLCIILTQALYADAPTNAGDYHITRAQYWKSALHDAKKVVTAPARWDKQDAAIVVAVIMGTAGLMLVDKPITNGLTKKKIQPLHGILAVTNSFGDGVYVLPALFGTYVIGEAAHNQKMRKVALLSIESFLIAGGFAQIGKYLFHRHRPSSESASPFRFDGPSFKRHHVSFPSGHTTCAFAVAAVISEEFKEKSIFIPIAAYSLASLAGIARIERKDHWTSDVFFGACLGVAVGKLIAKLHPENPINEGWEVCISPDTNGFQLALSRSF